MLWLHAMLVVVAKFDARDHIFYFAMDIHKWRLDCHDDLCVRCKRFVSTRRGDVQVAITSLEDSDCRCKSPASIDIETRWRSALSWFPRYNHIALTVESSIPSSLRSGKYCKATSNHTQLRNPQPRCGAYKLKTLLEPHIEEPVGGAQEPWQIKTPSPWRHDFLRTQSTRSQVF